MRICPLILVVDPVLPAQRPCLLCLLFGSDCLHPPTTVVVFEPIGRRPHERCQAPTAHEHCSQLTIYIYIYTYIYMYIYICVYIYMNINGSTILFHIQDTEISFWTAGFWNSQPLILQGISMTWPDRSQATFQPRRSRIFRRLLRLQCLRIFQNTLGIDI